MPLAVHRACGLNNFLRVAHSFAVIHFLPAKCKLAPESTMMSLRLLAINADKGELDSGEPLNLLFGFWFLSAGLHLLDVVSSFKICTTTSRIFFAINLACASAFAMNSTDGGKWSR